MSNLTSKTVYQAIWDADQAGNGVTPILSTDTTTPRDDESGYVIVDWTSTDKDHKVLQAGAVIPDKDKTYEKCRALFNNYELSSNTKETDTKGKEKTEIENFINTIKDTPPMKLAREYIDPGQTDEEWYNSIEEKWFTIFDNSNDRNGFEHVLVGENSGGATNIGGYHFWYKYYLDDGNVDKNVLNDGNEDDENDKLTGDDTIDFKKANFGSSRVNSEGKQVPEVVTLNFLWDPNDESKGDNNVLEKPKGGFWVGCSPEGLIALGMARTADGRVEAVINGALYDIILSYRKDKFINTFFPIFKEIVEPRSIAATTPLPLPPVQIIAALVNPVNMRGNETGLETVTLINNSDATVSMNGWSIKDKNNYGFELTIQLKAGESQTVTLSGAPRTAQLSNRGGSITLVDSNGSVVDSVTYSGSQAKEQGVEVKF